MIIWRRKGPLLTPRTALLLLPLLRLRVCRCGITEMSPAHAVLTDACLSHFDGSVLVWPGRSSGMNASDPFPFGTVNTIGVLYHPLRNGVPGHDEYEPQHSQRNVLLRAAPSPFSKPPAEEMGKVSWNLEVTGAAIVGTFTLGSGKYSSIWHGMLEPLVGVWQNIRRVNGYYSHSQKKSWVCPRYEVYLTDEVLKRKREWQGKYLLAFWRAFTAKDDNNDNNNSNDDDDDDDDRIAHTENDDDLRIQSILDAVTVPRGRREGSSSSPTLLSWEAVVQRPMTCYQSILIGAPCCSRYPFNSRGKEDILGGFGRCMLESFASPPETALDYSNRGSRHHHQETAWPRIIPYRRAAASSFPALRVLVLDRAECDRRISNPALLMQRIKAANISARHEYFERLTQRQQLRVAADSDLVIAAHGGGEGWMTVMPRGGVMIELRHQGASNCFAPFAQWVGVNRVAVDDLPRFVNSSCLKERQVSWTEGKAEIVADWGKIGPAIAAGVQLLLGNNDESLDVGMVMEESDAAKDLRHSILGDLQTQQRQRRALFRKRRRAAGF